MALMGMAANVRVLLCLIPLLLMACTGRTDSAASFKSADIGGAGFGRDLRLADPSARVRTLRDFRGKVVLLVFGYTRCPDVCPTTLSELAGLMGKLGSDAGRVQVLFVTLDPQRDSPEQLGRYVHFFHPAFVGLWGDEKTVAATAREFRVFYQKQDIGSRAGYALDHTAGVYAFDPEGHLRLLMGYGTPRADMLHDVRLLLRQ